MKIPENYKNIEIDGRIKGASGKDGGRMESAGDAGKTGGPLPRADKVRLSRRARDIQEVRKVLDAQPDVRRAKVEDLKIKIKAGLYKVDGKDIAQGMMKEMIFNKITDPEKKG